MKNNMGRRKAVAVVVTVVVLAVVAMLAVSAGSGAEWGQVDPALNGMDMLTVDESAWKDERTDESKPPAATTVWERFQPSGQ